MAAAAWRSVRWCRQGQTCTFSQTTPEDSIAVSRAGVIISNGFGLDDFLDPVIQSAKKADVVQVVAAEGLEADPIEGEPGRSQGDPHLWQNPVYAIHYVERIRDGLVRADLGNASVYRDNADAYIQQLRELDQEISRTLSDVPPERRHLVTFHDAFGHFAVRYGWRVSALVPGDASEVTPGTIVAVMERIGGEGISAVFAEPQFSPKVMEQVARDTGVGIGSHLLRFPGRQCAYFPGHDAVQRQEPGGASSIAGEMGTL